MTDTRTGILEEMTWPEVAAAAEANIPVILPVGSTEQHGPHLPLNTDCLLPVGIALEVAKRLPLVVAPPIRFGARSRPLSGGGEGFPGTLSLRATTLISTVTEVLQALARSGFRRLCVQNWHYENAAYLWEACDLAAREAPDARILLVENPMPDFSADDLVELFPAGFPGWDVEHASIMETSLMLALHPELVHQDRIVDDEAERHPTWDVVPPPAEFIPASGVLWHPTEASEAIGRRFLEAVADRLEDALRTEFDLE
jgi:creatinine amidohydrolase